jgi:hypothetical protein
MIHDRLDYFLERFSHHRHTIEFGRELDDNFIVKDLFSDTFPDRIEA